MNNPEPPRAEATASYRPSRRATLGLLGAVPLAAGGLWAMAGCAASTDETPRSAPVPTGLRPGGELDRLIAQLAEKDQFSGTVLVTQGDRTVLSRAFGMADKARSIRNDQSTIFGLASVTKMFTAVAIAQLVQEGRVAYHETIGEYLPGFPAAVADHVTVHQLLTHTSGVGRPSAGPRPDDPAWSSIAQVWDGTMATIRRTPLQFTPGAGYAYSNDGYFLLGAIVAEVAGQSYFDYVRAHVFRPAGMVDSDFFTRPAWQANRRVARPYTNNPPMGRPTTQRVETLVDFPFIGDPAGGAFSTTADLVRFAHALLTERLLDKAHTWLATTPKLPAPPPPAGGSTVRTSPSPGAAEPSPSRTTATQPARAPLFDGYAGSTILMNGQWIGGHSGGNTLGASTDVGWYSGSDLVAVVLSNYEAGVTQPIVQTLRRLATD